MMNRILACIQIRSFLSGAIGYESGYEYTNWGGAFENSILVIWFCEVLGCFNHGFVVLTEVL